MKLTNIQKQLLIEALLFSACVEINADWTEEHYNEMINLASSLKDEDTKLDNISVYKFKDCEVEAITQTILEKFKGSLNIEENKTEQFFVD